MRLIYEVFALLLVLIALAQCQQTAEASNGNEHYLDNICYNITFNASGNPSYVFLENISNNNYPTNWTLSSARLDSSGVNGVGIMEAENKSFNVSQTNLSLDVMISLTGEGGYLRSVKDVIIDNRKGKVGTAYISGLGTVCLAEVPLNEKQLLLVSSMADEFGPLVKSIRIKESLLTNYPSACGKNLLSMK
jgi:hypothetical protein